MAWHHEASLRQVRRGSRARLAHRTDVAPALALALALALSSATAHATISFQVTDLGVVPGTVNAVWSAGAYATGINNAGNVIGTFISTASGGEGAAFSWSPGAAAPTPLPGLGFANFTGGLSNNGVAVGYSFGLTSDPTNNHGALWLNGAVTDLVGLGLPAGANVLGINDAGQMAGTLADGSAFLWNSGTLTNLGLLGSDSADVFALNNIGQVAGALEGTLGGIPGAGRTAFVRQANGTLTLLAGLPGTTDNTVYGLNNLGQAVGSSAYGAVLWTPGMGPVSLPSFVAPNSTGVHLVSAHAINDLGQIAGSINDASGAPARAAVLTPNGTLNWTGAHGSGFSDGLNWDSGLGYAPSKFLDVLIAPEAAVTVVTTTESQAKSLTLGITTNVGAFGQGTLLVAAGTSLVVAQAITLNSGVLSVASGGLVRAGSLTQTGGTLTVDGALDTYGGDVTISNGTLNGNGSINTGVTLPDGSVSNGSFTVGGGAGFAFFRPGHSPGHFTVQGALTLAAHGELELQVERAADGSLAWDVVSADQATFLAGSTVHFIVGSGVAGSSWQTLAFLDLGQGASFGDGVNFIIDGAPGALVQFGTAGLQLSIAPIQAVPEPSHALLLLTGLLALATRWLRLSPRNPA